MIARSGTNPKETNSKVNCVQLELFQLDRFGKLESQEKSKKSSPIILYQEQPLDIEEEWFALTIDAPFSDCLLEGKKAWETRRTGTLCPKRVFIHTSQKKLKGSHRKLAREYLGESYQPRYGHIIGTGILQIVTTMTEEFIEEQNPDEIKLGIWKIGRKAWGFKRFERIEPIPAIGCQGTPWSIDKSKLNPHLREELQIVWRQS